MNEVALSMRQRVDALQDAVLQLPQVEPPMDHTFHGGMYCRQMFMPAGMITVGRVHKVEHFFFIVSGTCAINTDDGVSLYIGPCMLASVPGTKRAVYAETDTIIMTIHRTDAKTVADAEDDLVEVDPTSAFGPGNRLKQNHVEVLP